jgi:Fe-S-cluster containining protein
MRKFACITDCSDCCIYREYYPSKEFGKIGVLLLPEEKARIEQLAKDRGVVVHILPRIALGRDSPERIIAYQMMGRDDGDWCPFLDAAARSPHGGHACSIYSERPLACSAYPVIDAGDDASLDPHCQFCKHHSTTRASLDGLQGEHESLARIKYAVRAEEGMRVWRYATATGEGEMLPEGWVLEP